VLQSKAQRVFPAKENWLFLEEIPRLCFCWALLRYANPQISLRSFFLFVTVLFRICFVGKGQKGVFFEQIHSTWNVYLLPVCTNTQIRFVQDFSSGGKALPPRIHFPRDDTQLFRLPCLVRLPPAISFGQVFLPPAQLLPCPISHDFPPPPPDCLALPEKLSLKLACTMAFLYSGT